MPLEPAPLGPRVPEPAGDWRELEAERVARLSETLGERLVPVSDATEWHKLLFSLDLELPEKGPLTSVTSMLAF